MPPRLRCSPDEDEVVRVLRVDVDRQDQSGLHPRGGEDGHDLPPLHLAASRGPARRAASRRLISGISLTSALAAGGEDGRGAAQALAEDPVVVGGLASPGGVAYQSEAERRRGPRSPRSRRGSRRPRPAPRPGSGRSRRPPRRGRRRRSGRCRPCSAASYSSHSSRIAGGDVGGRLAERGEAVGARVVDLDAAEQGAVGELEGEVGRRLGPEPVDEARREQLPQPVRVLVGAGGDLVALVQRRALGPELRVARLEAVELVVAGAAAAADAEDARAKAVAAGTSVRATWKRKVLLRV